VPPLEGKNGGMPLYLTGDPGEGILEFYNIVNRYTAAKGERTREAFERARAARMAA
jgi:hypothetical protein